MDWKSEILKKRSEWYLENYQGARDFGIPFAKPYTDKTTNGLTRCISDWLKFHGYYSNRINTTGIPYIEKVEYSNRTVDKLSWRTGTTNKGTSDLISIINGRFVSIEIKNKETGDRISKDQLKEKKRVEASGGVYIIATCMNDFIQKFYEILNGIPVIE